MQQPDLYEMLQVSPNVEPAVIEAAYRRLARMYHPDIDKSPSAKQRMAAVTEAFEVLINPVSRKAYDEDLHGRGPRPSEAHVPSRSSVMSPTPGPRQSGLPIVLLLFLGIGVVAAAVLVLIDRLSSSSSTVATAGAKTLSVESLRNAEYMGWLEPREVRFVDGVFKDQTSTSTILPEPIAFGDVNSDGWEDAALIITSSGGGSGNFVRLALVLNQSGYPKNVAYSELGDRVVVNSLAIQSGVVSVDLLTHPPPDSAQWRGLCCPNVQVIWRYGLSGNRLNKLP